MPVNGGPGACVANAHGWRSGGRTSQARPAGAPMVWVAGRERPLQAFVCGLFMAIIAIDGEFGTTGPPQASVLAANVL